MRLRQFNGVSVEPTHQIPVQLQILCRGTTSQAEQNLASGSIAGIFPVRWRKPILFVRHAEGYSLGAALQIISRNLLT